MSAHTTPHFNHKPIGAAESSETPNSVISVAYALAKAKSEPDAIAIMQMVPRALYPALAKHINARPNLFLPEVRLAVASVMAAPKMSEAEALFS
jgi:hypothetical protein